MFEFLITSVVIYAMIAEKFFFYILENSYASTILGKLNIVLLVTMIVVGTVFFLQEFKAKIKNKGRINKKIDLLTLSTLFMTLIAVCGSFYLNINKISLHWDAIALYDARALFLDSGMKFSEMTKFAEYDNLNKYYYLLYPPYTSIAHYFWSNSFLFQWGTVSTYYSIVFMTLISLLFFLSRKELGSFIASIFIMLVATNSSIFNIVIKEYTNLPFVLYLCGGIFLLYRFFKTGEKWAYIFGLFLISTSMWIRLLEPIWLAILTSFIITIIMSKKIEKKIYYILVFVFVLMVEYLSWIYFTKVISNNPGFVELNVINIIDPILGIFTGSLFKVIPVIFTSWGIPSILHLSTIALLLVRWKQTKEDLPLVFLGLVEVSSLLIYLGEFYMISFQYDWWSIVTMSLDRSSTFMIPVSIFILLRIFVLDHGYKKNLSN